MGETIELTASDGHSLSAYRAEPAGKVRGGLVIVQEIFGVNGHIRHLCDDFAAQGYVAVAPALFDRIEPGVELGYDEAGTARGRQLKQAIAWDDAVKDIEAAMVNLADAGKIGVVGYCYGGSVAWLAATRLNPAAAVCYYGGQIVDFKDEIPNCSVQMHFGLSDPMILPEHVIAIQRAQMDAPVEVCHYEAGHGFSCSERSSFHAESTALALKRTLSFLESNLA